MATRAPNLLRRSVLPASLAHPRARFASRAERRRWALGPRISLHGLLIALVASAVLSACENIHQDKFMSQGGISPDPSAILEGSVLYIGPHPQCVYNPDGSFQRIRGNVVLTLFEYSNPPPPAGEASGAVNLFVLSGDQVFEPSHCLPPGASPNYGDRLTRSIPFLWSDVLLDATRAVDYQIRGFYDYDEDMIPFFSVTRLPTQGDIAGAALNDVQNPGKGFAKLSLPKLSDAPNGLILGGITVALGNPVWTERPAFRLDANRRLAADALFTPALSFTDAGPVPNGPATLRNFRALTCATGGTDGVACGLTLQRLGADDAPKLAAVGVGLDLGNTSSYAFYAQPVDITTVVVKTNPSNPSDGLDLRLSDGKVDPHPFLGSGLGLPWYGPVVILQRMADPAGAAIEAQARIPPVLLVGSVLLSDDQKPTKSAYVQGGVPIAIPPVAAVELIPNHPECRVPYFAPGTISLVTDGRLANCDELPTGHYAVNVLGGVAGGSVGADPGFPMSSESPVMITGGGDSGQSWSIPNELSDARQVSPAHVVAGQGFADGFIIHDPSPDKGACGASSVQGLCTGGQQISENVVGVDSTACLQPACCAYVSHLCGVPTCAKMATPDGNIAASPTKIVKIDVGGGQVPDCVPFELPWQCCRAAP